MSRKASITGDRARQLVSECGSVAAAARKYGIAKTTLSDATHRDRVCAVRETAATRTLASFREQHDIELKIRHGLKTLLRGDRYMTDAEFREAVQANPARWRAYAERTEFEACRLRVRGEWLWAAASTIAKMKKILGIA
jgi:hypothetical protein